MNEFRETLKSELNGEEGSSDILLFLGFFVGLGLVVAMYIYYINKEKDDVS